MAELLTSTGWASPEDHVEKADARLLEECGVLERNDAGLGAGAPSRFRVAATAARHPAFRSAAATSAFAQTHLVQAGAHAIGMPTGWSTDDPGLLRAQGAVSAVWAGVFERDLLPHMTGLAPLMWGDPAFLDVGVGVGSLSIALCRRFPRLHAVGLDVFKPALDIAVEEVGVTGLEDRIALRRQSVDDLSDRSVFDLVWLPQPFIAPDVLEAALPRVHAALRPGGWLIVALGATGRRGIPGAFDDLLATVWGGGSMTSGTAVRLLTRSGFVEVTSVPVPLPAAVVVARRPEH